MDAIMYAIVTVLLTINLPTQIECNDWSLLVKTPKARDLQKVIDDPDYGVHFTYGKFDNEVYGDHCNQTFSHLKYVKIGDTLTITHKVGNKRYYKCIAIETMKVCDDGQIRDQDGQLMGDSYAPCVVLYTCKGKDRLVTIWKEI